MKLAVLCFLAYFFGSFPFGVVVARFSKGVSIQELGSGNIGAANAFRTLGAFPGLLVLLGDMLKGMLALAAARLLLPPNAHQLNFALVGLCAILGHVYSVFLRFKGGKGVATLVGVFFFISWKATLSAFSLWGIVVFVTGFASLASLTASLALPFFLKAFGEAPSYIIFAVLTFLFVVYTHRSNIQRLLAGKENKFTFHGSGRHAK